MKLIIEVSALKEICGVCGVQVFYGIVDGSQPEVTGGIIAKRRLVGSQCGYRSCECKVV